MAKKDKPYNFYYDTLIFLFTWFWLGETGYLFVFSSTSLMLISS